MEILTLESLNENSQFSFLYQMQMSLSQKKTKLKILRFTIKSNTPKN